MARLWTDEHVKSYGRWKTYDEVCPGNRVQIVSSEISKKGDRRFQRGRQWQQLIIDGDLGDINAYTVVCSPTVFPYVDIDHVTRWTCWSQNQTLDEAVEAATDGVQELITYFERQCNWSDVFVCLSSAVEPVSMQSGRLKIHVHSHGPLLALAEVRRQVMDCPLLKPAYHGVKAETLDACVADVGVYHMGRSFRLPGQSKFNGRYAKSFKLPRADGKDFLPLPDAYFLSDPNGCTDPRASARGPVAKYGPILPRSISSNMASPFPCDCRHCFVHGKCHRGPATVQWKLQEPLLDDWVQVCWREGRQMLFWNQLKYSVRACPACGLSVTDKLN